MFHCHSAALLGCYTDNSIQRFQGAVWSFLSYSKQIANYVYSLGITSYDASIYEMSTSRILLFPTAHIFEFKFSDKHCAGFLNFSPTVSIESENLVKWLSCYVNIRQLFSSQYYAEHALLKQKVVSDELDWLQILKTLHFLIVHVDLSMNQVFRGNSINILTINDRRS